MLISPYYIVANSFLGSKEPENQYIMYLWPMRKKKRSFSQKICCSRKLRKKFVFCWFSLHFKRCQFFIWRFLDCEVEILAFHWVDLSNALWIIPVRPIEQKRRSFDEKNQNFNKNFQYIKALTFASLFVRWHFLTSLL